MCYTPTLSKGTGIKLQDILDKVAGKVPVPSPVKTTYSAMDRSRAKTVLDRLLAQAARSSEAGSASSEVVSITNVVTENRE